MAPLVQANTKLTADFAALQAKLEKEPVNTFSRDPATGGNTTVLTDC